MTAITRDLFVARRRHPIVRYVSKRFVLGVVMLVIVSVAVFFFTQALPGDVARQVLGQNATATQIATLRAQLGLDRPVWVQYFAWVHGMLTGDFGTSLTTGMPVSELLAPRIENSAALVAFTVCVLVPVVLVLGTGAALRPKGLIDKLVSALILVVIAIPEFIVAIFIVMLLATNVLRILPPTSIVDHSEPIWGQLGLFVLPVLALVVGSVPYFTESIRTLLREELSTEYVSWARLSGLSERRVLWRFAVPNAIGPSLQVAGTTLVYLTGGVVVVENVFSFPGIGTALTQAVANRDIPVVQTISMLLAAVTLLIYLGADVVGMLLTPKLRRGLRS